MKNIKIKKERQNGFFKENLIELLFEVAWDILMYIPRMMIRLIMKIWDS
ncbi:hypothetical protein [Peribacillus butanolivorans]